MYFHLLFVVGSYLLGQDHLVDSGVASTAVRQPRESSQYAHVLEAVYEAGCMPLEQLNMLVCVDQCVCARVCVHG